MSRENWGVQDQDCREPDPTIKDVFDRVEKMDKGLNKKVDRIQGKLKTIDERTCKMAGVLDDVLAKATANNTAVGSMAEFLKGLKKKLDDVLSGEELSPAARAKVNEILAVEDDTAADIANAILENTPQEPEQPLPTEPTNT